MPKNIADRSGLWGVLAFFPLLCTPGCSGAEGCGDSTGCGPVAASRGPGAAPERAERGSAASVPPAVDTRPRAHGSAGPETAATLAGPPAEATAADTPAASALFVDPASGSDGNDGSSRLPLKTLKQALIVAPEGATLYLRDGIYDAASDEDWEEKVPAGVSLRAVLSGAVVFAGRSNGTGLSFRGSGAVTGVVFQGFRRAVGASSGDVSIDDCTVQGGGGFDVSGDARVTVTGVSMSDLGFSGLIVRDSADVTMSGGSIAGTGPATLCQGDAGIVASGDAAVHLVGVAVRRFGAGGVQASESAEIDIAASTISETGQTGCDGAQLVAAGASDVSLDHTVVVNGAATGLLVQDGARLELDGATVGAHDVAGVRASGGTVTITDSTIRAGTTGVAIASTDAEVRVSLEGSLLQGNAIGVEVGAGANLRLRTTHIAGGDFGVHAPTAGFIDLGAPLDPGGNAIVGAKAALTLSGTYDYARVFDAVGNTWNPNVQGADADGKYANKVVTGSVAGPNFVITHGNVAVRL